MAATVDAYRLPLLSLPRVSDDRVIRSLEGLVLATATSAGLVGTSLVAGRLQAAVATATAVGHLTVASTLVGRAVVREVPERELSGIVGLLAALTTLALLVTSTHASAGLLAG